MSTESGSDITQRIVPKVAVGLPVFNGEKTVAAAIETVLSQSFGDFTLIISDNCSTDATQDICLAYAERDSRIRYYRQPSNFGGENNFRFVLEQAESEYFMWAAADDVRSPDFIEANLDFLERHRDYVCSTCPTRFDNGQFDALKMGDASLDEESAEARFIRFFSVWHSNGRYCSLFRRDILRDCYRIDRPFLGCDWTVVLRICLAGKTNRVDRGWIAFGSGGISHRDIFSHYRKHWYQWLVPFSQLYGEVRKLTAEFSPTARLRLFLIFASLNAQGARVQLIRSVLRPLLKGRLAPRREKSVPGPR